jgi:hypothetical protein
MNTVTVLDVTLTALMPILSLVMLTGVRLQFLTSLDQDLFDYRVEK